MQLTDFLDRYQIYYAIIRFIMNYQPINRFIEKKYKIKVPGGLSNRYQKGNLWYRLESPPGALR